MTCQIVIVDCGMGNLHSVRKKLSQLDCTPVVSSNPRDVENADKIVLPGVGHFQSAMDNLKALNLLDALNEAVLLRRKPVLGICLGMQLMATASTEGDAVGLGWIDGEVVKFQTQDQLKFKIPHVGWNQISILKDSRLMNGIPTYSEFYFLHSYYLRLTSAEDVLNETEYEHSFTSAIEHENILGVQYHPEKSHDSGDTLLRNFADL